MEIPDRIELQAILENLIATLKSDYSGEECYQIICKNTESLAPDQRVEILNLLERVGMLDPEVYVKIRTEDLFSQTLPDSDDADERFPMITRLQDDNTEIIRIVDSEIVPTIRRLKIRDDISHRKKALDAFLKLEHAERHYHLIEQVVFLNMDPVMVAGISRVMDGMHVEILRMWRAVQDALADPNSEYDELLSFSDYMIRCVRLLVLREEELLLPALKKSGQPELWEALLMRWDDAQKS